jgi:hypothetical protein
VSEDRNSAPFVTPLDHVWFWRVRLPERKDEPCRVIARGAKNSVLVEFADGVRVITSRYAVRKRRAQPDNAKTVSGTVS